MFPSGSKNTTPVVTLIDGSQSMVFVLKSVIFFKWFFPNLTIVYHYLSSSGGPLLYALVTQFYGRTKWMTRRNSRMHSIDVRFSPFQRDIIYYATNRKLFVVHEQHLPFHRVCRWMIDCLFFIQTANTSGSFVVPIVLSLGTSMACFLFYHYYFRNRTCCFRFRIRAGTYRSTRPSPRGWADRHSC